MSTKTGYKIIHVPTGKEATIGSVFAIDKQGGTAELVDWEPPKTCPSTGRVWLKYSRGETDESYYPSVIDCKIVHESGYKVVNGRICDPGKFEGEPLYVHYFWDMLDESTELLMPDGTHYYVFRVSYGDENKFPELTEGHFIALWETNDGFVQHAYGNETWYKAWSDDMNDGTNEDSDPADEDDLESVDFSKGPPLFVVATDALKGVIMVLENSVPKNDSWSQFRDETAEKLRGIIADIEGALK